jgi:hypothetical protein
VSLSNLLLEVESLESAFLGGTPPEPERFLRLDSQVRAVAESLSKFDLQALYSAMQRLGSVAEEQRRSAEVELSKVGGDRRAVRGYGCLRSSSQGQRISKKA